VARTMIDILRKGNQELFHSSMIAWLLDPKAEHGLGARFLEGFANKLARADGGSSKLKEAVKVSPDVSVRTESSFLKSRYDIEIHFGDERIIVENKTKSVGEAPQLDRYKGTGAETVALGLSDVSFTLTESDRSKHHLILYRDVLDILRKLESRDPSADKFAMLIEDYREYLERELSLQEAIVECYEVGKRDARQQILDTLEAGSPTENDRRFLSLFLLENFQRACLLDLRDNPRWEGAEWRTDKNHPSGVWLANDAKPPTRYSFVDPIKELCRKRSAMLWFHVELKSGVFERDPPAEQVGELQLRCSTRSPEQDNQRFLEELKKEYPSGGEEERCYRTSKPGKTDGTFYVARKYLSEGELVFGRLEESLTSFCEGFGSFDSPYGSGRKATK
jgi:PD-(D/E)XK nuclease superfamily